MINEYDRYTYARRLFDERKYTQSARELEGVISAGEGYGLGEAELLLARSYYHSAQLDRARQAAADLIERDPTDGYAALLLARSLDRLGRADEAATWHRRATLLDAPS